MIQTVTWWGQRPDQFANVRIQKRFLWFFFVVVGYILERVAAHPSAVEVTGNPAMSAESAHPDKWHEGKDLVALPLDREDELPGLDRLKARELNLLKDVVRPHQQFCLWVGPHPTSKSRAVRKEQANIFPHRTRGQHHPSLSSLWKPGPGTRRAFPQWQTEGSLSCLQPPQPRESNS